MHLVLFLLGFIVVGVGSRISKNSIVVGKASWLVLEQIT